LEIFKEGIRFIEREEGLQPDQKEALIEEVRKGKSPTVVLRWVWILLKLTGPGYGQLAIHEKEEVVKGLLEGLGKGPKQAELLRVLGVYFPSLAVVGGRVDHEGFFNIIIRKVRDEERLSIQCRLVEILVRFSKTLPQDAAPEDFRAGLYHPDDPFRCRCLLFLQQRFQSHGLRLVIREIRSQQFRPSSIFSETLSSLIRQDPRVSPEIRAESSSGIRPPGFGRPAPPPSGIRLPEAPALARGSGNSRWDLIERSKNNFIDDFGQKRLHPLILKRENHLLRKERLELIAGQKERR